MEAGRAYLKLIAVGCSVKKFGIPFFGPRGNVIVPKIGRLIDVPDLFVLARNKISVRPWLAQAEREKRERRHKRRNNSLLVPLEIDGEAESEKNRMEGGGREGRREKWRWKGREGWKEDRVFGEPEKVISWVQPDSPNPHLNQSHFPFLSSQFVLLISCFWLCPESPDSNDYPEFFGGFCLRIRCWVIRLAATYVKLRESYPANRVTARSPAKSLSTV